MRGHHLTLTVMVPEAAWLLLQMWGQLVRNAREWIRMTAVYFPKELHAESLAYVQVPMSYVPTSRWLAVLTRHVCTCLLDRGVDSYTNL